MGCDLRLAGCDGGGFCALFRRRSLALRRMTSIPVARWSATIYGMRSSISWMGWWWLVCFFPETIPCFFTDGFYNLRSDDGLCCS